MHKEIKSRLNVENV